MGTYLKNTGTIVHTAVFGFAKCHFIPDNVVESLGKYALKLLNVKDIVNCYLQSSEEAWSTESGVQMIKTELEVTGANELLDTFK